MPDPRKNDGTPEGKPDDGTGDSKGGIPKERVDAMLATAKEETRAEERRRGDAALQREREARADAERRAANPPAPSKPDPTAAELQKLVDDEIITPAAAQATLAEQQRKVQDARIDERVRVASEAQALTSKLNAEMDEYMVLDPDIKDDGSETRARIEAEIVEQGKRGVARSLQSELLALRTVLGPLEKLRTTQRTAAERETDRTGASAGGGHGAEGANEGAEAGPPDDLPNRFKTYYGKMIQDGLYTGWDDPKVVKQLDSVMAKRKAA